MKSAMYDTLVEAIGDYLGKGIELLVDPVYETISMKTRE